MQALTHDLKVFLVDDSVPIQRRLAALLAGVPGITIVGTARTPDEALTGIAETQADVAIVDLRLAGGNGLAVLKTLATQPHAVVSIVLTNCAIPQFRWECARAGARFFFDKTTEFARVRDAVRQLVADQRRESAEPVSRGTLDDGRL